MRYVDQRAAIRRGEVAPVPQGTPDESWTNDAIKEYLDSQGIEYRSHDTKDDLLGYLP